MNQISKSEGDKPKSKPNHQYDEDEIFMKLITSSGYNPFPRQAIMKRIIVIPFRPHYTIDQPEP